jgi:hypothetical protein
MYVSSGSAQLHFALKKLRAHWEQTAPHWGDRARQEFEAKHLAALENEVSRLIGEIGRLDHVLRRAQEECG